jgi:hypothetical protein
MAPELKHVYCYQVGSDNCYKIGRTKNPPDERMRGFATGSPVRFTLYRDIKTENSSGLEKYIHHLLDPKRAENGEFFNVDAQELDDAVDQAVTFMEEFQPLRREANKLRRHSRPNHTTVSPSEEMRQIYKLLRKLTRDRYFIEQRIELLASKIQVAIGDNDRMEGVASWKWRDRWTINTDRFKREQSALYEDYKRNSGGRIFQLERVDLTKGD